jgi:hypothetical protein
MFSFHLDFASTLCALPDQRFASVYIFRRLVLGPMLYGLCSDEEQGHQGLFLGNATS